MNKAHLNYFCLRTSYQLPPLSFSARSADMKAGLLTPPPSAGLARPVGKGELPSGSGGVLWPGFSCFSGLSSCRNSFSSDTLPHSRTTSSVQRQELPQDASKPVPRPGSVLWTTSPCTPEGACPAGSTNISPQQLQHHRTLPKEAWISDLREQGGSLFLRHLSQPCGLGRSSCVQFLCSLAFSLLLSSQSPVISSLCYS